MTFTPSMDTATILQDHIRSILGLSEWLAGLDYHGRAVALNTLLATNHLAPDEQAVGALALSMDRKPDMILQAEVASYHGINRVSAKITKILETNSNVPTPPVGFLVFGYSCSGTTPLHMRLDNGLYAIVHTNTIERKERPNLFGEQQPRNEREMHSTLPEGTHIDLSASLPPTKATLPGLTQIRKEEGISYLGFHGGRCVFNDSNSSAELIPAGKGMFSYEGDEDLIRRGIMISPLIAPVAGYGYPQITFFRDTKHLCIKQYSSCD